MNKLDWQTRHNISIDSYDLPCSDELYGHGIHDTAIRRDSKIKHKLKTVCWWIFSIREP